MKALHALADRRELEPIDVELGALLVRRAAAALGDADEARVVALTGALLSSARARGHSCLELASVAGRAPFASSAELCLPDVGRWRAILERSRVGGEGAPLVLDGDRLYLRRFHRAEQRLADAVRARVSATHAGDADERLVALFRALFPAPADGSVDWQAVAAAAALRGRLTVVTGGPGAGKTTTVARILALLLHRDPALRIALAAPTGKAATRLAESIAASAERLPIDGRLRERLPREGRTLHRLLGYQPWSDRFAHGAASPLAEDVIVVDEASMVDVLLMDALLAAARPGAHVILLGDQDQLASVETGYVLGDLCRAAESAGEMHGRAFAEWVARLAGATLPSDARATPMRDAVVRLRRSYRFETQPGIGALADAVRTGDASRAVDVIESATHAEVRRRDATTAIDELLAPIGAQLEAYLDAPDPAAALDAYARVRVLCALREGATGVAGLNEGVERWLRRRGVFTRARWYDRRPVLVTANDAATGLFNGDVGITWSDAGRTTICFPDGAGGVRAVPPSRLPAHETAWAMTVHKSQGSEAEHILFVLPQEDARVLTRELVYTAVTRARRTVDVVGDAALLALAIGRATTRGTGLAERLR